MESSAYASKFSPIVRPAFVLPALVRGIVSVRVTPPVNHRLFFSLLFRIPPFIMRRTTLGPVSNSGLNVRSSAAQRPPRMAGSYKPGEERRQSAFPTYGAGSRRATSTSLGDRRATSTAVVAGSSGNPGRRDSRLSSRPSMSYSGRSGMRSDPRPLHDKHYMQKCVKDLISFVIDRGYDLPISPKILTNPSARDFQHIFLFLVQRIDPTFTFQKRFEDEVPAILRCLAYPFSISKSALSAVGSPHTWPSLLGVLTWLMGLLKYDEAKQEVDAKQDPDPAERRQKMFYDNTVKAYDKFLGGEDSFPELDEELSRHFEAENKRRQNEIAKLQADRDKLAATLEALQTQPSPLELATDQHQMVETNIVKFRHLIDSLIQHDELLQQKSSEKDEQVEKVQREVASLTEEKDRLMKCLASQEEAGIDAERILVETGRLKQSLNSLAGQLSQAEDGHRQAERELASTSSRLNDAVRRYEKLLASLSLSRSEAGDGAISDGASSDRTGTSELEIVVSQDAAVTDPAKLISRNVENDVVPCINVLKEEISAEKPVLQERTLSLQESVNEVEEQLIVERSKISLLESSKSNLENDYKRERAAMSQRWETRKEAILQKEEQFRKAQHLLGDVEEQLRREQEDALAQKRALEGLRKDILQVAADEVSISSGYEQVVRGVILQVKIHFDEEVAALHCDGPSKP